MPRLWKCPRCSRPFANRNQPHSCGRFTVAAFLRGRGRRARALFRAFADACGPARPAPARTPVGFQVRMIFAAVNRLTEERLDAHVVLPRRVNSPRSHVHHFRVRSVEEIDAEVRTWLDEARRAGS